MSSQHPAQRQSGQRNRDLADEAAALLVRAQEVPEPERAQLRDEAITSYLWLADSIARRYRDRGEEADDLVQVARSGLVEAAQRYDARHGSFPGFAVPTITGVIKRHFRDHGWLVRPPRSIQETRSRMSSEWPRLTQELGEEPTDAALAQRIGRPETEIRQARTASAGYASTSLDAVVNAGLSTADEDGAIDLERAEVRLVLARAWQQITRAERQLLIMRYFEDRSQSDIAAEIGTSQMQVSRMLTRLFRKMQRLIDGPQSDLKAS